VHDIHKLFYAFTFWRQMESIAVCQVFEECPEKHGTNKPDRNFASAEAQCTAGIDGKPDNEREIHTPDNQRVTFGEKFQNRILKKLRLPFVMDFLKLHGDGEFVAANLRLAVVRAAKRC